MDIDGFYKASDRFANNYNTCYKILQEKEANYISPYSPDYWNDFMTCWVNSGASDDFRKLERKINDISWYLGRKGR